MLRQDERGDMKLRWSNGYNAVEFDAGDDASFAQTLTDAYIEFRRHQRPDTVAELHVRIMPGRWTDPILPRDPIVLLGGAQMTGTYTHVVAAPRLRIDSSGPVRVRGTDHVLQVGPPDWQAPRLYSGCLQALHHVSRLPGFVADIIEDATSTSTSFPRLTRRQGEVLLVVRKGRKAKSEKTETPPKGEKEGTVTAQTENSSEPDSLPTDWNEIALLPTWTQDGRTQPRVRRSPAAQHVLNGSSEPTEAIHRAAEAARYAAVAPTLSADDWQELARAAGRVVHLRENQARYLSIWPERRLPGLHGEQRFANSASSIAYQCEEAESERTAIEERIWGPPIPSPTADQVRRLEAEVVKLREEIPAARVAARTP